MARTLIVYLVCKQRFVRTPADKVQLSSVAVNNNNRNLTPELLYVCISLLNISLPIILKEKPLYFYDNCAK